ncbi:hypothetical protein [Microbispora oryzae]|uniref:hypothetical protein n=1 Tax=Microbispora oryzae TaxID=2806554 RepID=UPI003555C160
MARFDVTDAEWALIEPHLPVAATGADDTDDTDASSGQDRAAARRRRKAGAKAAGLGRSRGGLSGKIHAAVR